MRASTLLSGGEDFFLGTEIKKISRRAFVKIAGLGAVVLSLAPTLYKRLQSIEVVVLRPLKDQKYSNAAKRHFANKIYPSKEAALQRLPHRGLRFQIETCRLHVSADATTETLFQKRQDLDIRVVSDQQHMEMLGITEKEVKRLLLS